MEKEILDKLKALARQGRKDLASLRRRKREGNGPKHHTFLMEKHGQARKSGLFQDLSSELFAVNRILDRDNLSAEDRKSFTRRRRDLLKKMNVEKVNGGS
jgi:hypothetical protein